jgi:hypothetical protein
MLSRMAGSTKRCLFCGKIGVKLTAEDVYPRWLRRAMNIQGPITLWSADELVRVTPTLEARLREVCAECNNRWLHDLERAFRSVMLLPLNGLAGVVMPEPVQMVVALWAVKQWLLLERSLGYVRGQKALDSGTDNFRWMREHSEPPPQAQVWIGAVAARNTDRLSFVATRFVGDPPNPPVGISGVFAIGCVLFQVYLPIHAINGVPVEQAYALGIGPPLSLALIQIWPHESREVEWPPERILAVDELDRIWPSGGHLQATLPPTT